MRVFGLDSPAKVDLRTCCFKKGKREKEKSSVFFFKLVPRFTLRYREPAAFQAAEGCGQLKS
jgi:hypothetical protein